ncbi:hypothetical protein AALO_G00269420 [Alosa alosa]|uniref:A-kinase anchor protein 13-like n=1 Tax=Alosa alosa TaxID=278164 RepID=A0AAV6FMC2_9TELE|nr:A-kinase anchor protein 13 [Alosa alosa]KAG5263858.1 hypothetical protein AALO_G00269420 [Alosa alosa]
MKVNPQQAPLYGNCVLTVQLSDEELAQAQSQARDVEGAEFYLLFSGSRQTHLSTTLRTPEHGSLQALCPAHDCCESVLVTLCATSPGGGAVEQLGQARLQFVQDLAFDMAQFLVSTVGRTDGLDGVLMLDECQIPLRECERLDHNLALALRHLHLPEGWSLLGDHLAKDADPEPQETLLHFACRRGLLRVASFLLQQRGALEALRLPNKQGCTPTSLAHSRGHQGLLELLNREGVTERGSYTGPECHLSCGAGVLEHSPVLGTFSLSVGTEPGTALPSLQEHLEQLCHLIQRHAQHSEGGACVQGHERLEPEQPDPELESVCESVCESEIGLESQPTGQECSGERQTSESDEAREEPEQRDPLSSTHEQDDPLTTDISIENTHLQTHTHASAAGLPGEHAAPRASTPPLLVCSETSPQPIAGLGNQRDGEECVWENTEQRDSHTAEPPAATTAAEEHVELGDEEEKEEDAGVEEEAEITAPDNADAPAGLSPEPETGAEPDAAPGVICPTQGGVEGGREEDRGPQRAEEEEEEEEEQLPDQKHPSGLGGVADAAEARETAESPETAETAAEGTQTEAGEETAGTETTAAAAAAAAAADMGLTQSAQEPQSSDTDFRDCSQDVETDADREGDGEGEGEEWEDEAQEEAESREENEEFVDASSTSIEGENSLFVECSDSMLDATVHSSSQFEDPGLAKCPGHKEQRSEVDGTHEEACGENEVEVDQTAASAPPLEDSVETETELPSDHVSDSAETTFSEDVDSPGEQTKTAADSNCDGDITSPVSDSGCDLTSFATDPDVTSLDETAEGSSDTHLIDSTEADSSEPLTASVDSKEDLDGPECRAEGESEEEAEHQDQEDHPLSSDAPEMTEASQEREAHSDASLTYSEESRPASSDDTLEGLDEDSSTMSESEVGQKLDAPTGRPKRIRRRPDAQASDAPVCADAPPDTCDSEDASQRPSDVMPAGVADCAASDAISLSDITPAHEVESAQLRSVLTPRRILHTHTHLSQGSEEDREGVETSAMCVPEETHTLEGQGEPGEDETPESPCEAPSPGQVSEQVTAEVTEGVAEGVTEEFAPLPSPRATQSLEVPITLETTQEMQEEVPEEVTNADQQDSSTDEALPSVGSHMDSERPLHTLMAAGAPTRWA